MTTTTTGNLTLCRNGELLAKRPAWACEYNEAKCFCPYCFTGQSKAVLFKVGRCYACNGEVLPSIASYETEVARGS